MRRWPRDSRCVVAAWPPEKLVAPTLTIESSGSDSGSSSTNGIRTRSSASRAVDDRVFAVTAMTARRPAAARSRAQEAGSAVGSRSPRLPTTTAMPSSAPASTTL